MDSFIFFTVKSTIKKLIITNDNFLIKPFLISISVILGYSFFNPYINNTIGLFFILLFLTTPSNSYEFKKF